MADRPTADRPFHKDAPPWEPPAVWTRENVIEHLKDHAHKCRCIVAAIHFLQEHSDE